MKITKIIAYQIYDSRGLPTVACKLWVDDKIEGLAMVPSGASTGEKEACELRDKEKEWMGKGVNKAIDNINNVIAPKILNHEFATQRELDNLLIKLDGTKNKTNLGANAILATSLAYCKACANKTNKPLFKYIAEDILGEKEKYNYCYPIPMVNVLNGGCHSNNGFDFQEIMLIPKKQDDVRKVLQIVDECFLHLQKIICATNKSTAKGDEGGFSINFANYNEAFELLIKAIENAGYVPGKDVAIAIDVAASEFYAKGEKKYVLHLNDETISKTTEEMVKMYCELINKYPIISIEDPFDENDWEGFVKLKEKLNDKVQIVGDDLYCTNCELLKNGIEKKATNAILIKLNQIGTLTECIKTIELAKANNINTIISHRSGETEDTFIADLAIAIGAKQIKTGSFARSERLAKYNRIIEIDQTIKKLNMPE